MDSLRKKLLLNIFVTPVSMAAGVLGATLVMVSWIIPSAFALGLIAVLIAFGAVATNLVFNIGKISEKAAKDWYEQETHKRENELDDLDEKLARDRDRRDEIALRNIRVLYGDFCDDVKQGKISAQITQEMLGQVDEIFHASIGSLEYSYELLEMSKRVDGNLKDELKKQRDGVLVEVENSITLLAATIAEIRQMKSKAKKSRLSTLQKQLSQSLAVAKKVDELRTGQDTAEIMEKYSQYLK